MLCISTAGMSFPVSLYDALVSIAVPTEKARAVIDAMERERPQAHLIESEPPTTVIEGSLAVSVDVSA